MGVYFLHCLQVSGLKFAGVASRCVVAQVLYVAENICAVQLSLHIAASVGGLFFYRLCDLAIQSICWYKL